MPSQVTKLPPERIAALSLRFPRTGDRKRVHADFGGDPSRIYGRNRIGRDVCRKSSLVPWDFSDTYVRGLNWQSSRISDRSTRPALQDAQNGHHEESFHSVAGLCNAMLKNSTTRRRTTETQIKAANTIPVRAMALEPELQGT